MKPSRIGIYSGTFDPVHSGHISFALQAMTGADLDHIYFLPERKPRNKQGVEHFAHRVAMLKRAIKPHPKFGIIELVDVSFSVRRTLTELERKFPEAQLVFLLGSDTAASLPDWPHIERLFATTELVIGARDGYDVEAMQKVIDGWAIKPVTVTLFESYAPSVSSTKVREALRKGEPASGLLPSVMRYSNQHWLYVSIA